MTRGEKYSEVAKEQLLQTENEYIIESHIINHEGEAKNYTIKISFDSYRYSEDVLIPDGRIFTYIHHIYPDRMAEGVVSFAINKEGEDTPFEEITYYISFQQERTRIPSLPNQVFIRLKNNPRRQREQ